jgi:hypothetical protein
MEEIRKTAAEIVSAFEEYLYSRGVSIEETNEEDAFEDVPGGNDCLELEARITGILEEAMA